MICNWEEPRLLQGTQPVLKVARVSLPNTGLITRVSSLGGRGCRGGRRAVLLVAVVVAGLPLAVAAALVPPLSWGTPSYAAENIVVFLAMVFHSFTEVLG